LHLKTDPKFPAPPPGELFVTRAVVDPASAAPFDAGLVKPEVPPASYVTKIGVEVAPAFAGALTIARPAVAITVVAITAINLFNIVLFLELFIAFLSIGLRISANSRQRCEASVPNYQDWMKGKVVLYESGYKE
jgi:hypothetical protein